MEFLGFEAAVLIGIRLIGGFLAAVAGIFLWSQSREPAWILVILATLLNYIEILFQFLDKLGIFSLNTWMYGGVSVLKVGFAAVIPLLYLIAFVWAYVSGRRS